MVFGAPGRWGACLYSDAMKRELVVTVGGREIEITVEPPAYPQAPDARWRVVVDGRELQVDARPVRPGTWSLILDGKSHVVDLDPRASGTAVSSALAEAIAKIEDARTRKLARAVAHGHGGAATGEELRAPIAGKVVKLLVAEGDTVAAGQGVIVLEAMKMENELAAERGGTVGKIHKQAGQPVDSGELLVTLT
jgi:biotin carboxyl carrier protein